MNKFKTAWDDYNKSSYKKKVLMDQVSILSVKKINDGVVYLYEISPMLLRGYPYEEEKTWKLSDLPGWAIRMLSITGFAFRIEKKLYLVDELTFRSLNDLFGWTRNASEPSIWRDFHLAQLFKERDYAYLLYTKKDKYRVVSAIHKTGQGIFFPDAYIGRRFLKDLFRRKTCYLHFFIAGINQFIDVRDKFLQGCFRAVLLL